MKHLFSVVILALAVLACSWEVPTPPAALPTAATTLVPVKKHGEISSSTPSAVFSMVEAEKGLRLRDLPDASGPDDSRTIVVMPDGSRFEIEKCEKYHVQWWAYGTYTDADENSWTGWAAARYLKNGCSE